MQGNNHHLEVEKTSVDVLGLPERLARRTRLVNSLTTREIDRGCLVPLVDTLKKPLAKWAKKNYPAVISSALETLLSFLLVEPEIPEPPPVEEPSSGRG